VRPPTRRARAHRPSPAPAAALGPSALSRARTSVSSAKLTLQWSSIGLPADQPASLRDLWARAELGTHTANFTALVPPHGVVLVRATQQAGGGAARRI
jgi:alpha-galactosidase